MFKVPEKFRVTTGPMRSDKSLGNCGAFNVKSLKFNRVLNVIASDGMNWEHVASDGMNWEHVSVSTYDRCPTWEEMCFIKDLFWDKDDLVVQFHPVESEYVNNHEYCLHLWRKIGTNDFCETPETIMVGTNSK